MLPRLALLLPVFGLLCCSLSPASLAATWLDSSTLVEQPGYASMSKAELGALRTRLSASQIGDYLGDPDIGWIVHKGDLRIDGSFDNSHGLVVDGNLTIAGDYDDYGDGIGLLVVLGNLQVDDLMSWGSLYVQGDLNASGLVIAEYNDFTFEVDGKVNARGLVVHDKSSSYESGQLGFVYDDMAGTDAEQAALAVRHLVPELYDVEEFEEDNPLSTPSYDHAVSRMRAGEPLFRQQPAPAALVEDLSTALGSNAKAKVALVGSDPLIDRVLAAHAELDKPLRSRLLATADPEVRNLLAARSPDEDVVGDPDKVSPELAETVLASEALSPALLVQLAASPDPQVRRLVATKSDLPSAQLLVLAGDDDTEVRRNLVSIDDNAQRLPLNRREALARDADAQVRAAIAATPLPLTLTQTLSKDPVTEVRAALGRLLAEQTLGVRAGELTTQQREAVADSLVQDPEDSVRLAVFPALSPERQVQAWRDPQLRLRNEALAEVATSGELLGLLLTAAGKDYAQHERIAENPAIPPTVQLQLVKNAEPSLLGVFSSPDEDGPDETAQTALDELLGNPNVTDAALLATARDVRPPLETTLYNQHDLPPEALALLDERWRDFPLNEDWSLTLILQRHASREQLEMALPRWYDSNTKLAIALKTLHRQPDSAWWTAMAANPIEELREAVAHNVNLPAAQLETLLQDPVEDVALAAAYNPALSETSLRQVALRDPELALANDAVPEALLRELATQGQTWEIREDAQEKLLILLKRSR
ncbi:MAG: hypothetical protein ABWY06_25620 [Pseudomonas sp.]|uniref:hypothetical protein n=1 Tax=Pseudomonas sp. TaxID=306 RepID=UPI003394DD2C